MSRFVEDDAEAVLAAMRRPIVTIDVAEVDEDGIVKDDEETYNEYRRLLNDG